MNTSASTAIDPIRFYHWPIFGPMYRRRVELCLGECRGGESHSGNRLRHRPHLPEPPRMYKEIHGLDLTADTAAVQAAFAKRGISTPISARATSWRCHIPKMRFRHRSLISILEHLKPEDQPKAFAEIRRVLKPGGQVVYGVPIERPLMVFMFQLPRLRYPQGTFLHRERCRRRRRTSHAEGARVPDASASPDFRPGL